MPCDATRPAANKDTMSRPELNGLAVKDGVLRMRRPTLDPVRARRGPTVLSSVPGPQVLTNFPPIAKDGHKNGKRDIRAAPKGNLKYMLIF